jgi:hypothetical protein
MGMTAAWWSRLVLFWTAMAVPSVQAQNNDLFQYGAADVNENGLTNRGQANWDQVRCGNADICVSVGLCWLELIDARWRSHEFMDSDAIDLLGWGQVVSCSLQHPNGAHDSLFFITPLLLSTSILADWFSQQVPGGPVQPLLL